jgi:hypothetical protein
VQRFSALLLGAAILLACGGGDQLVSVPADDGGMPDSGVVVVPDGGGRQPDSGVVIVPPNDGGTTVFFDGGTCAPADTQQACYSGPPGTLGRNGCRPGVTTCQPGGYWGPCAGEVAPQSPGLVDLVFIFDNTDTSCVDGMGVPEFTQVQEAATEFVLDFPQTNFRYGLLTTPGCGNRWPGAATLDAGYALYQPMTDEQQEVQATGLQCLTGATGSPACASSPGQSLTLLSSQVWGDIIPWDTGAAKFIVYFTSAPLEPQNSVLTLSTALREQDTGVQVLLFVDPQYQGQYQAVGQTYPLETYPVMLEELETAFSSLFTCGG